jgi:hypothetical protein
VAPPEQHGRKCRKGGTKVSRSRTRRGWVRLFLQALAETGNVTLAAQAAGVCRACIYRARRRHPALAQLWDEAIQESADLLLAEARRRAYDGVDRPVVYKGELQGVWVSPDGQPCPEGTAGARFAPLTIKEYSDKLLLALLAAYRPEEFGRAVRHQHEHKHRIAGHVRLSVEQFRQLPLDERIRLLQQPLSAPDRN